MDDAYNEHAWINLYLHRTDSAYGDALKFLELKGTSKSQSPYMVVVAHLALRQNNKTEAAESFLAEWIKRFDSSAWTTQVMRYLRHDMNESQLLALATDNDKMTEAHAYIWNECFALRKSIRGA